MSRSPDDALDPPKPTSGDLAYAAARGAMSAIPWVGGLATEIVSHYFGPPLAKRLEAWQQAVADTLRELRDRGIDVEKLRESNEFIDVVVQASRIAMQTSSEAKRRVLLNAIANVALGRSPAADMAAILMRYIDELTPSHLRLLEFLREPTDWYAKLDVAAPFGANMQTWITAALSEFRDTALLMAVWNDLRARDLVPREELILHDARKHVEMRGLSRKLLEFVAEPEPLRMPS